MSAPALPEIVTRTPPPYDHRLRYGTDENHFGDLRLPKSEGPQPVVMVLHGGYWRSVVSLEYMGHACAALTASGYATWNLEYRRVGNGGGWPETFDDVVAGYAYLRSIAPRFKLDMSRCVLLGHSAGAQLALCLAAREGSVTNVVGLGGVLDLRRAHELHLRDDATLNFMRGTPEQIPEKYKEASPIEFAVPRSVKQRLLHGTGDVNVPLEISERYLAAKQTTEDVQLVTPEGVGHFEPIDPQTSTWKQVEQMVHTLARA